MRKTTRFFAFLMILALLAPAALAEGKTYAMLAMELEDPARDWTQNRFFQVMEARTGIAFAFDKYNDEAGYQAAKEAAFADGGALPDVLFKACLTDDEEMAWGASGQLVDLAPYLEAYAPNLYAILEARPDWRAVITQPDGKITSLPFLNGADRQAALWINSVWLNALGLDMPTTIDEYTQVLRAFRDGDPNANGKRDEIPLSIVGPWEAKFLLHAWGLVPNDYNIYVDGEGKVQFAPYDGAYYDFVQWLNMALSEGLLYADAFRMPQSGRSNILTTSSSDSSEPMTIGSMLTNAPFTLIDMSRTQDYAVLPPLQSADGSRVYRQLLNGVARGMFAITSAAEADVGALLGWVDYLYTEEGGRLAFAGLEGEDYTFLDDGTWTWTENEDDFVRLSEVVEKSIIAGDGITPGLEPAAFMRNGQIAADTYARRQTDVLRDTLVEPYPVTWPTDAAREARIAELQMALATTLDTAIANFASGQEALTEASWQALLDELDALGVDEFVQLWQAKYDELGR